MLTGLETLKITGLESKPYAVRERVAPRVWWRAIWWRASFASESAMLLGNVVSPVVGGEPEPVYTQWLGIVDEVRTWIIELGEDFSIPELS